MAEIEFSVLSRSCLKQRLSGEEALRREVDALVKERNAARATINWRFNTRGRVRRVKRKATAASASKATPIKRPPPTRILLRVINTHLKTLFNRDFPYWQSYG